VQHQQEFLAVTLVEAEADGTAHRAQVALHQVVAQMEAPELQTPVEAAQVVTMLHQFFMAVQVDLVS